MSDLPCKACDGQGGTDGYTPTGEPLHFKVSCEVCNGSGDQPILPSAGDDVIARQVFQAIVSNTGCSDAQATDATHAVVDLLDKARLKQPSEDEVERVARAIDPHSFRMWQGMFDYCIKSGDDEETARRYADSAEGPRIEKAKESARAAKAALREQSYSSGEDGKT